MQAAFPFPHCQRIVLRRLLMELGSVGGGELRGHLLQLNMHKCLPNALLQLLSASFTLPSLRLPFYLWVTPARASLTRRWHLLCFFISFPACVHVSPRSFPSSFLSHVRPASFRSALHFQGFVSFICINFHFPLTLTVLSTLPRYAPFLLPHPLPSILSFLSTKPSVNFMQFQSIRFA